MPLLQVVFPLFEQIKQITVPFHKQISLHFSGDMAWLIKAMGCPSYIKIAPITCPDASVSITKTLVKSGSEETRVKVKAFFNVSKAFCAFSN